MPRRNTNSQNHQRNLKTRPSGGGKWANNPIVQSQIHNNRLFEPPVIVRTTVPRLAKRNTGIKFQQVMLLALVGSAGLIAAAAAMSNVTTSNTTSTLTPNSDNDTLALEDSSKPVNTSVAATTDTPVSANFLVQVGTAIHVEHSVKHTNENRTPLIEYKKKEKESDQIRKAMRKQDQQAKLEKRNIDSGTLNAILLKTINHASESLKRELSGPAINPEIKVYIENRQTKYIKELTAYYQNLIQTTTVFHDTVSISSASLAREIHYKIELLVDQARLAVLMLDYKSLPVEQQFNEAFNQADDDFLKARLYYEKNRVQNLALLVNEEKRLIEFYIHTINKNLKNPAAYKLINDCHKIVKNYYDDLRKKYIFNLGTKNNADNYTNLKQPTWRDYLEVIDEIHEKLTPDIPHVERIYLQWIMHKRRTAYEDLFKGGKNYFLSFFTMLDDLYGELLDELDNQEILVHSAVRSIIENEKIIYLDCVESVIALVKSDYIIYIKSFLDSQKLTESEKEILLQKQTDSFKISLTLMQQMLAKKIDEWDGVDVSNNIVNQALVSSIDQARKKNKALLTEDMGAINSEITKIETVEFFIESFRNKSLATTINNYQQAIEPEKKEALNKEIEKINQFCFYLKYKYCDRTKYNNPINVAEVIQTIRRDILTRDTDLTISWGTLFFSSLALVAAGLSIKCYFKNPAAKILEKPADHLPKKTNTERKKDRPSRRPEPSPQHPESPVQTVSIETLKARLEIIKKNIIQESTSIKIKKLRALKAEADSEVASYKDNIKVQRISQRLEYYYKNDKQFVKIWNDIKTAQELLITYENPAETLSHLNYQALIELDKNMKVWEKNWGANAIRSWLADLDALSSCPKQEIDGAAAAKYSSLYNFIRKIQKNIKPQTTLSPSFLTAKPRPVVSNDVSTSAATETKKATITQEQAPLPSIKKVQPTNPSPFSGIEDTRHLSEMGIPNRSFVQAQQPEKTQQIEQKIPSRYRLRYFRPQQIIDLSQCLMLHRKIESDEHAELFSKIGHYHRLFRIEQNCLFLEDPEPIIKNLRTLLCHYSHRLKVVNIFNFATCFADTITRNKEGQKINPKHIQNALIEALDHNNGNSILIHIQEMEKERKEYQQQAHTYTRKLKIGPWLKHEDLLKTLTDDIKTLDQLQTLVTEKGNNDIVAGLVHYANHLKERDIYEALQFLVTRVYSFLKELHCDVEKDLIRQTRNRIAHHFGGIKKPQILAAFLIIDLPLIKEKIQRMVPEEKVTCQVGISSSSFS